MHRCSSEPSSKLRARSASRRYIYIYTYARVVLLHIAVFSRRLQVSVYICTHHVCCVTMHLSLSLSLCVQVVDFLRRQIHRDSVVRHITSRQSRIHRALSLSLSLYRKYTCVAYITDSFSYVYVWCICVCVSRAVCVSSQRIRAMSGRARVISVQHVQCREYARRSLCM